MSSFTSLPSRPSGSDNSAAESHIGHIVNILDGTVTDAEIVVKDGLISDVVPCCVPEDAPYYLPGFIDSHVHIESSMMLPAEFARIAGRHGTVGAICDPHEIANVLGAAGVELMLERKDIVVLSEMMNYPGVLNEDPEVMAKIDAARRMGKPVDGHAPGLTGGDRRKYSAAGISTDHECTGLDEARDAVASGMKILIREGSAA